MVLAKHSYVFGISMRKPAPVKDIFMEDVGEIKICLKQRKNVWRPAGVGKVIM